LNKNGGQENLKARVANCFVSVQSVKNQIIKTTAKKSSWKGTSH